MIRGNAMYKVIATISAFIRIFILPNPFAELEHGFLLNIIIGEPLFHALAFGIVGLFYKSGDAPVFGSIMYLIVYWILVLIVSGIVIL